MRRTNNLVKIIDHQQTSYHNDLDIHQLVRDYLRSLERRGLSKYTLKHEKENLQAILKLIPSDVAFISLNASDLETLIFDRMRSLQLKPTTLNGRLKTLRRFYQFIITLGYLNRNPALLVNKMKNPGVEIPSLSLEQIHALLRQPDVSLFTGLRDKTIMCLMLDTGIRLREALDLEVKQTDLKNRLIHSVPGKNGKVEDIPITIQMCKQLKLYLENRGNVETDKLFINIDGNSLNRRTFQQNMKDYGIKARITDVRVSPHTLRHSFAKQWILNGGDVFTLQKMLRHSTMDMVKRYVYMWGHEVQKQHDKFSPLSNL